MYLSPKEWRELMSALDDLAAAVAANTTATNNAVAALGTANDTTAIEAAVAQLDANNTALTNAVTPPAAPEPPAPSEGEQPA